MKAECDLPTAAYEHGFEITRLPGALRDLVRRCARLPAVHPRADIVEAIAGAASQTRWEMGMTDEMRVARPPAGWLVDSTTGQTRWWDGTHWTEHIKPADSDGSSAPMTRAARRTATPAQAAPVDAPPPTGIEMPHAAASGVPQPHYGESTEFPLAPSRAGIPSESTYPQYPGYSRQTPHAGPYAQSYAYSQQPTSKNGPAKASLILILLLVLGVGAVFWFLSGRDPVVAGIVALLNVVMVLAAFVLSIVGLVIAVRRPTKKRESVFGLVVSSLFLIYLVSQIVGAIGASF